MSSIVALPRAGQGFRITPDFGGMRTGATMQAVVPDTFVQAGDTIDAENPIEARRRRDCRPRRPAPCHPGAP